jgi:hypothetical protein
MSRIGWLDCSSGVSGDMLLGALHDLGALDGLPVLLDSLSDLRVGLTATEVTRAGLRATAVTVDAGADQPHRRLADVRTILDRSAVPDEVRRRADAVFVRLATAEARCHGTSPDQVEFHEVGAVDAIVDVLGSCLGLHTLGLAEIVVGPISLGGGTARSAPHSQPGHSQPGHSQPDHGQGHGQGHGSVPVPTPAALELLRDSVLVAGGGGEAELATPTGVAVVAEWAGRSGPMPAMNVAATGIGAGTRDPAERPNVLRVVVGTAAAVDPDGWLTVEANVDDLDPRLWPGVLARLIEAGAADAWLTPILMKKGRPAHVVSALVLASDVECVYAVLFAETSTIGARATAVTKRALDRSSLDVDIDGQPIRVKIATDRGKVVNISPEFDDVAAAAAALGMPVKDVLAAAGAAARARLGDSHSPR